MQLRLLLLVSALVVRALGDSSGQCCFEVADDHVLENYVISSDGSTLTCYYTPFPAGSGTGPVGEQPIACVYESSTDGMLEGWPYHTVNPTGICPLGTNICYD